MTGKYGVPAILPDGRQNPEWTRAAYLQNREVILARGRESKRKNKDRILAYKREFYRLNRETLLRQVIEYRNGIRLNALKILGAKCSRCGIDDIRVLQVDHINGGGTKEYKAKNPLSVYRKIASGQTDGYQILCSNCNWIKRYEKGEGASKVLTEGALERHPAAWLLMSRPKHEAIGKGEMH